jgi:hypothetical protein
MNRRGITEQEVPHKERLGQPNTPELLQSFYRYRFFHLVPPQGAVTSGKAVTHQSSEVGVCMALSK